MNIASPPLTGVKVLDFTQIVAGPYLASLLGDMGADVIKVEPPWGDPVRNVDSILGPGISAYFTGVNRSKRSLALDLTDETCSEVRKKLIEWADVVLISFKPETSKKLSLDYKAISQINPSALYLSLTAWGEDGPRASDPGMDIMAQAVSGIMGMTGEDGGPPTKTGPAVTDFATAYLGGFAVCAALYKRSFTGVGEKIAINLLDASLGMLGNFVTPYMSTRIPIKRQGSGHPQLVPYQAFSCQDAYLIVACLTERFWQRLCEAIGQPTWINDRRFSTNADRVANREDLVTNLEEIFATNTVAHWTKILSDAEVPCCTVNSLADALEDPQVIHNQMLRKLEHPTTGAYYIIANPIHMGSSRIEPSRPAPTIGEHSEEILEEIGMTGQEKG